MKKLILLSLLLASYAFSFSQSGEKSNPQQFLWNYQLPEKNNNGPMEVLVKGNYYFKKDIIGTVCKVYLHFKVTELEFMSKYGTRRYKYKGQIYREDEVRATDGLAGKGFDDLNITSVRIRIRANHIRNPEDAYIGSTIAHTVGEVDKDADLNNLSLNLVSSEMTLVNWTGGSELEARLSAMNKLVDNRQKYKTIIAEADEAFKAKNWEGARRKYQQASGLFNSEPYPKSQLARIDKALEEQKLSTAPKSELGSGSNTGGNFRPGYGGNASTAVKKQETVPGSTAVWKTGGNEGRQEGIPPNAPPMIMDKSGNHYVQDASGKYVQTSKEHYDRVKKEHTDAKNKLAQEAYNEQKKKNEQELLDKLHASQNKFLDDMKAKKEKDERDGELMATSYYKAEAKKNVRSEMNSLSTLDGSYESLEALQNAYLEQRSALYDQQEQLVNAGREHVSASMDYAFKDANANVAAYKGLATGLANMASDAEAEKEARAARIRLENERRRQEQLFKERKQKQLLDLRRNLLKQCADGGVPFSWHKVSSDELYFFSYIIPAEGVEKGNPSVLVSNVFSVQRSADGTWPYKSSILNELKKAAGSNAKITLVGYYTDEKEAIKVQESFVGIGTKSEMAMKPFLYKRKKTTGSATVNNADLWNNSNGKKPGEKSSAGKSSDLWNKSGENH